jgi:signal transduction histidine kinase/ligand-binding sensor protein
MLTSLHAFTGAHMSLVDADGTILFSAGEPDLCTLYYRTCPQTAALCEQSDVAHAQDRSYAGYRCLNGLIHYARPVTIEGERVATLFTGQLFHEPPDEQFYRHQAQEYGFDTEAYIAALHRVAVIPKEQFQAITTFLAQLADSLASIGIERKHLLETTAALAKSEAEARSLGAELEQRVVERTAELAAANQELSRQEASLKQAVSSLSQREATLNAQIAQRDRAEEALHRLNADLVRAQKRTERVLRALEAASGSLELNEVLLRMADEVASALGLSMIAVFMLDANGNLGPPRAVSGNLTADQIAIFRQRFPQPDEPSIVRMALEGRKPVIWADLPAEPLTDPVLVAALKIKSALAIPLQRSDRILGVAVGATVQGPRSFTAEEIDLALGIAGAAALAIENAGLFEETRRRLAEVESFARVIVGLLGESQLEGVLDIVCTEAQNLIGATGSAVLLLEEDGWLHVVHSSGRPRPGFERVSLDRSIAGMAIERGEPVLTSQPDDHAHAYELTPGVGELLAMPLRASGGVIGALDAVNKPGGFTADDVRVMQIFASQAAVAIEHARLHRQAAQLAVVEERQRLARELHDSVTQALYGVTLFAKAASTALAAGKQETAAGYLQKLRETAQDATADMRLLVFQLHPPALEKEGLVGVLQARLAAVEARAGLKTELQIEGEERRLPIDVEEELYGMAQEGLNNVLKHAKATRVRLRLEFRDEGVSLEVRDNGLGFDPAARVTGGVGLRSIAERAARVQGRWTLVSQPDQGTRLVIDVPSTGPQG